LDWKEPGDSAVQGVSLRNRVVIEPANHWPAGYVESFTGVPDDFTRPPQGKVERVTQNPHTESHAPTFR